MDIFTSAIIGVNGIPFETLFGL